MRWEHIVRKEAGDREWGWLGFLCFCVGQDDLQLMVVLLGLR